MNNKDIQAQGVREENKEKPFGGRYRPQSFLGQGVSAYVLTALDLKLNRMVALKVAYGDEVESREHRIARFRKEAEIGASLQHPHIVRVMDFGVADEEEGEKSEGEPFIVLDYIQGEPLRTWLERTYPPGTHPDIARVLDISIQVADALHYIHSRTPAIVHRDIRADNILINENGHVFLTDWGTSRRVGTVMTLEGPQGTKVYMAPEVLDVELAISKKDGKKRIDARADIYSFGILMYYLATARVPYIPPENDAEHRELLKDPKIQSMETLNPHCPKAFSNIVLTCMAYQREDRFESSAILLKELRMLLKEIGGTTSMVKDKPKIQSGVSIHVAPKTEGRGPQPDVKDRGPIHVESSKRFRNVAGAGLMLLAAWMGLRWISSDFSSNSSRNQGVERSTTEPAFSQDTKSNLEKASTPQDFEKWFEPQEESTVHLPVAAQQLENQRKKNVKPASYRLNRSQTSTPTKKHSLIRTSYSKKQKRIENYGDELVVFSRTKQLQGNRREYGVVVGTIFNAVLTHKIVTTNIASPSRATLIEDFIREDQVIFPAGTKFLGRATSSSGTDRIHIRFDRMILPDETEVRISAEALDTFGALGIAGVIDRKRSKDLARSGSNVLARAGRTIAHTLSPTGILGGLSADAMDASVDEAEREVEYHTESLTVITVEPDKPIKIYVSRSF